MKRTFGERKEEFAVGDIRFDPLLLMGRGRCAVNSNAFGVDEEDLLMGKTDGCYLLLSV